MKSQLEVKITVEVRCALVLRLFEFIATFLARLPAKFVFTIKNQDSYLSTIVKRQKSKNKIRRISYKFASVHDVVAS